MRPQLKYGMGKFNPTLTTILIDDIGGLKKYIEYDKESRYIMIGISFDKFKQEMIYKFGSQSNYIRNWLERNGFKKHEYLDMLAQRKGFKNQNKYLNYRYQLKGFKDRAEYQRFKRLKVKFPFEEDKDILIKLRT